jgi:hypothetical protein
MGDLGNRRTVLRAGIARGGDLVMFSGAVSRLQLCSSSKPKTFETLSTQLADKLVGCGPSDLP